MIVKTEGESGTKEKILEAALDLFSKYGYDAVSISDISNTLGLSKGALYKHYENKRDILKQIIAEMEKRDASGAADYNMPADNPDSCSTPTSIDDLIEYSKNQFLYWTEDPFASKFRRMLTLEQYRAPEMGKLYREYLSAGPLGYVIDILKNAGLSDPAGSAISLYAPMFLFYSVYDSSTDKPSVISAVNGCLDSVGAELKKSKKNNY